MPCIILGTGGTVRSKSDMGDKAPAVYWKRQSVNEKATKKIILGSEKCQEETKTEKCDRGTGGHRGKRYLRQCGQERSL